LVENKKLNPRLTASDHWVCPECAVTNHNSRKNCLDCGTKRPTNIIKPKKKLTGRYAGDDEIG